LTGLVSYGGDQKIVVARGEIERIAAQLAHIQNRLITELSPLAQLNGVAHHLQLDAQIPETLVRLGLQRQGCYVAAESYFTGDARIAHQFTALVSVVNAHPWLQQIIPKSVWLATAALVGVSSLTNSNFTALGVRAGMSALPAQSIGEATSKLKSSGIQLSEEPAWAVYPDPASISGLASRLNNRSGHIRIESYKSESGRLIVMYLPGTAEWNPLANQKAFDIKSDVELMANGEKSTSYRAANAALNAFGVNQNDRLVLVGYSQGGMVASELAEKHFNVVGLVTFGSPIAREQLPGNLPVLSLEHSNDLVPALSGKTNPMTENWVTGSRHVEIEPGETVLKAHRVSEYVATAALADTSTDSGLMRIRRLLLANFAGSEKIEEKEYLPLKGV
jgi:hypothetical protein